MTHTEHKVEPWLAGLLEHRIALAVAATASVVLMIMLVMQPGSDSSGAKQAARDSVVTGDKSSIASNNQANSDSPKYAIPGKSLSSAEPRSILPPPAIRSITPAPPGNPVNSHQQAPVAAKKASVPVSPAVQAKSGGQARKAQDESKAKLVGKIFFIQVAAYRERGSAQQQAAKLLQNGWNSTIASNAKGWFTVRIGPVNSRDAADKLSQDLMDKAKLKGFVVED